MTNQCPMKCICVTWASEWGPKHMFGNGHHPHCDLYKPSPLKVYSFNDVDWYIATTPEEAIETAMKVTGMSRKDLLQEYDDTPEAVSEADMFRLKFVRDDDTRVTFAEEFMARLLKDPKPQFFASTEF